MTASCTIAAFLLANAGVPPWAVPAGGAALGLLLMVCPKVPGASWIGRLPGDVYIDRPDLKLYVPLGTCLLASLVLTLVLSLFRR